MSNKLKRTVSAVLALLILSSVFVSVPFTADAAKKKYVKSIKVSSKKVTLTAKKSKTVKVTVSVSKKATKKFTVKTSKKSVATAKITGTKVKITAKNVTKKRTAKITVTTKGKNKKGKKLSKTISVVVNPKKKSSGSSDKPNNPNTPTQPTEPDTPTQPTEPNTPAQPTEPDTSTQPSETTQATEPALESITVTISTTSISVGGTAQVTVVSNTPGAEISKVEYISSNEYLATVNSDGVVSGQHASFAPVTITVRAYDSQGNVAMGTVNLVVSDAIDATVTGIDSTAILYIGATKQLNPIANIPEPVYSYYSSDENVATVDNNGLITAVAEGTANIVVSLNGTNATAVCAVTVKGIALGIKEFSAIHADVLKAEFTTAVSEADRPKVKVTLKKGSSTLNPIITWVDDGKGIELTNDSEFEATSYSISIASNDVSIDTNIATATCDVQKRELKGVKVSSMRIPQANGAKIYFDALDNYGDAMKNITANKFKWTFSCSRDAVKTNLLELDDSNVGYLVLNNLGKLENVVVDDTSFNIKVEWKEDPLAVNTISEVAISSLNVQHIEINSIIDGAVYESATDKYYTLDYTAVDQYGAPIDWELYLEGAYNSSFSADSNNENLVSAPIVYDGKLVVQVKANMHGEAILTITGNDLKTSSLKIQVLEAPKPQKIEFPAEGYSLIALDDKDVKIPVKFIDQYGNYMTQGVVTEETYKKTFSVSCSIQDLSIDYTSNTEGDFVVINACNVEETSSDAKIRFSTYDSEGNSIDTFYSIKINEARKPHTIRLISEVPTDLVKGEEITLKYEVLDNHGDRWNGGGIIVRLIASNKVYLDLLDVTLGDDGVGEMKIKATNTSHNQANGINLQFELYDEDEVLISKSKEYQLDIYDNLDDIKFTINSSETVYKSGQTVNIQLTAYYNNGQPLKTYNRKYTDVLFTEYTADGTIGGTQFKDVEFIDGVANVQLQVLKAGQIYYKTMIPAVGASEIECESDKSIQVVPSDANHYEVMYDADKLTVTCFDQNDNVKTDYSPSEGTYISLENDNLRLKASDYISNVASADNKTNAQFVNGVLTLDIIKEIPSGTIIKVTTGNVTGSFKIN